MQPAQMPRRNEQGPQGPQYYSRANCGHIGGRKLILSVSSIRTHSMKEDPRDHSRVAHNSTKRLAQQVRHVELTKILPLLETAAFRRLDLENSVIINRTVLLGDCPDKGENGGCSVLLLR